MMFESRIVVRYESRRARRAVGRRRQGQDRRPAHAALLDRRALSGRTQRRPHGVRRRHEVRPAPDSVGHPASRRHLRHRQRRRRRSAGAVRRGRRARRSTASTSATGSSSATRRTSSCRITATSTCCRRRGAASARSARRRAASARPTRTRSRAAASASAIWPIPTALEQNVRDNVDRAQPPRPGLDDGLAAGARPAAARTASGCGRGCATSR